MVDALGGDVVRSGGAYRPRLLVLGYGNSSRGDDALAPRFVDIAQPLCANRYTRYDIEFLTDFQLQIEHTLDLVGFDAVLFVNASVACGEPFECGAVLPQQDESYSTHTLTPRSLLAVFRKVQGTDPPPSSLLAIRGREFELGQPLSLPARVNLAAALMFFLRLVRTQDLADGTGAIPAAGLVAQLPRRNKAHFQEAFGPPIAADCRREQVSDK